MTRPPKPVLAARMTEGERSPASREKQNAHEADRYVKALRDLGPSCSVDRFTRGYGKVGTRKLYAYGLLMYIRWLRSEKRVILGPDDLIRDNLVSVFKSDPIDTTAERRHTDYLSEYVNTYLVGKNYSEESRASRRSHL